MLLIFCHTFSDNPSVASEDDFVYICLFRQLIVAVTSWGLTSKFFDFIEICVVQARLGEVNQSIKQEEHAHALMQQSYPEGSTSHRYTCTS